MRRLTTIIALTLSLAACGGDDSATTSPPPTPQATPPNLSGLPPQFVQCMADQGIDIQSSPEAIHSPEGDACFNTLHEGGGLP